MWDRYRDWMYAWETRLNARDTNRVARPLEWGLDWTEHWPVVNGTRDAAQVNPAAYFAQLNQRIVSAVMNSTLTGLPPISAWRVAFCSLRLRCTHHMRSTIWCGRAGFLPDIAARSS